MWLFKSSSSTGSTAGKGKELLFSTNGHQGRQTWEWHPNAGSPEERARAEELRAHFARHRLQQKHSSDELLRLQCKAASKHPLPSEPLPAGVQPDAARVTQHLQGAISFYECMQQEDGHWPGDYGGPMFLLPGMLITCYTTGVLDRVFSPAHKHEAIRYLRNHQNEDGGYGLHIEGSSTMFGTALSYVSVRLLGVPAEDEMCVKARSWIHSRGGAHWVTSWGKFWLAVLGVHSWDGLNPMPPEMWLLPHSKLSGIGFMHPGRFWCHCRMVYLPMSYVYGRRGTCQETPLTAAIRKELYPMPYDSIDWNAARNQVAKEDLYYPHPMIQDVLWWALYKAEGFLVGSWIRKKALAECMKHIHYEDRNTRYVDIGPVNKAINMLACWLDNPASEEFERHIPRIYDYLWVAEDGLKMQGYNGSQLWDTSFATQALISTGMFDVAASSLKKAHTYIRNTQVVEEAEQPLSEYYRHISKGAWPFSTRDHGWPISDCSSEGLKAALSLAKLPESMVGPSVPKHQLFDCISVILSYQNFDGGMATYENTRSLHALEVLNPSETFGNIMVDYSYVECTSACITALVAFRKSYPDHRPQEIATALDRAEKFIRSIQRPDGSWYGCWAVCFMYACWFGVSGLVARGYSWDTDEAILRTCEFVLKHQQDDGGWGESYLSCQNKVYSQLPGPSHVVNTAWGMLTLMEAGFHKKDAEPLHRAARHLMNMQQPNGDWPQQTISGVFNHNCMITYANYRNIFPLWALGMYRRLVLLGENA